jgi:aminomethyltransferase
MVPFAGWEMPLSYTGVVEEHLTVRRAVGLFDVSHMGRIEVAGPGAADLLQRVATSDVKKLAPGRMQYALALNEQGGILDDLMIYRFGGQQYDVCANASNAAKILGWLEKQAAGIPGGAVSDRTRETAQIAVQGPRSLDLMKSLSKTDLGRLMPRHSVEAVVAGVTMRVSRSGYTGEPGYELYLPADRAEEVWAALLEKGRPFDVKPCGLGCRDTLRLEMGYPLYGNDMDETITPLEAALEFGVDFENSAFIGRKPLLAQKEKGVTRRRIGFVLTQPGVPRHGHTIFSDGKEIGVVSSGNHSPSLNKGIGMGYVQTGFAETGGELLIEIRTRTVPAVIVEMPFYKRKR